MIVITTSLRTRERMNILDELDDFIKNTRWSKETKIFLVVKRIFSWSYYYQIK